MNRDALIAVYRTAAKIAGARTDWTHEDWARTLCEAAKAHGVDPRDAATAAAEAVVTFMAAAPDGVLSRETAVASFRYVADQTSPG